MPSSPTPRSQYSTYHMHCTVWASDHLTSSPLPVRNAIEALSVQLAFTACCLDPPVLDLWDHSLRPKVLYPVAGPPCRSGNLTRWNTRPCPAALNVNSISKALQDFFSSPYWYVDTGCASLPAHPNSIIADRVNAPSFLNLLSIRAPT